MRKSLLLLTITSLAASAKDIDLAHCFVGIRGTFVLLDSATGKWTRYDPVRAKQRLTPCSTFKIPNSAIAIETGVAPDADFTLAYNPRRDHAERPEWARDHNLRSAFQYSVVWYYQEMARRAGPERMARYVRQFHYGNEDTSGGVDHFWLGSTLRISANEQVDFLKRFYEQKLGLSERTTRIVKDIMIADHAQSWRLSAKTGACHVDANEVVLWYVGYVEKGGHVLLLRYEHGRQRLRSTLFAACHESPRYPGGARNPRLIRNSPTTYFLPPVKHQIHHDPGHAHVQPDRQRPACDAPVPLEVIA